MMNIFMMLQPRLHLEVRVIRGMKSRTIMFKESTDETLRKEWKQYNLSNTIELNYSQWVNVMIEKGRKNL